MSALNPDGLRSWVLLVLAGIVISLNGDLHAESGIGAGELGRILADHVPQPLPEDEVEGFHSIEFALPVDEKSGLVTFSIPGFDHYGCGKCHSAEALIDQAVHRMREALKTLRQDFPSVKNIPLKQYIIQPYADEFLNPQQFAHATFDTVRIFPRSVIVDEKVYKRSTHLHETFHLTQTFVGYANELEAYGINAQTDPRFLLMNFPYFADVLSAFFLPELDEILEDYFSLEVNESVPVPAQVQRFLNYEGHSQMEVLRRGAGKMKSLFQEVSRVNRKYPMEAAYLTARTRTLSLLLDISAVKLLPLPTVKVSETVRKDALREIAAQMEKSDNTRLGYVIDRKKEALLILKHKLGLKNISDRRGLYFLYIKNRYLKRGQVVLAIDDKEDFQDYIRNKIAAVEKMLASERITPVELAAGRRLIEGVKSLNLPSPPSKRGAGEI